MPEVVADGVRLRYSARGRGRPILLLHGFSSSYRGTWERTGWAELLVDHGFRTVGPDARGHGRSDKPHDPEAYTSDRLVADAVAVLDHTGVSSADVFGYSMGAGVALGLATEHAERVRTAVVGGIADAALDRRADRDELAALAAALEAASEAEISAPAARRLRWNAVASPNDLRALAACLRNGRGWPGGLADLRPVAAPVLLVVAEDDQYMRGHEELRERLERAEVLTFPGRDHHDLLHEPRLKKAVLDFLRR